MVLKFRPFGSLNYTDGFVYALLIHLKFIREYDLVVSILMLWY